MIHSTLEAPSHSRMAARAKCERLYFYRYIRGLETKEEFPPAFMGSALHVGLDVWHRTENATAAVDALCSFWGTQRFFGDWQWVTPGHASIVLQNYMASKHTQDWDVVKLRLSDLDASRLVDTDVITDPDGYLQLAEASFVVDIPELGLVLIKPDLLLRTSSSLRVVDHKSTTGYLGSKLYNRAKFEHQLRLYALGFSALLKEPVMEGLCNGIYSGETASSDKFKGKRFDPYVFDYSAADFVETKAWYRVNKERMRFVAEHFTEQDELSASQNPGDHCGYCDYSKLCSAPTALRNGLVKLNYRVKEVA